MTVKKRGVLIPNAPFKIQVGCPERGKGREGKGRWMQVGEKEVGDAGKVGVSGSGLSTARTQAFNEFLVDTRNAGFGGLSVSLEGPSKAEIQCRDNKDGTCAILYKPTEPGIYLLGLKFADHHVPGSPFSVQAAGPGLGTLSERISTDRAAPSTVEPGKECELCLRLPGVDALDLTAKLQDAAGRSEAVQLLPQGDGLFALRFTPRTLGVHAISVLHKRYHVAGPNRRLLLIQLLTRL